MKKYLGLILSIAGLIAVLSVANGNYDQNFQSNTLLPDTTEQVVEFNKGANEETEEAIKLASITVGSIDTSSTNGAYYYRGTTSENCSKIVVEAENSSTELYDSYQLTDYTYGDSTYYYGIREDWNNLDEGLMQYTFTAYCDNEQVAKEKVSYLYTKPSYQTSSSSSSSSSSYSSPSSHDDINYYINVDGNTVQSPTYYDSKPSGASAKCKDGTYSFSQHRQGTCSGHEGVLTWY